MSGPITSTCLVHPFVLLTRFVVEPTGAGERSMTKQQTTPPRGKGNKSG